jgi:TRAP-type C4-dicarboxylate transport system permease small subunit
MDETFPGRIVTALARYTAIAGGVALVAITVSTVLSVTGRAMIPLGLGPIRGDYELVEAGVLFAVFAFLPWAHLTRGHAVVGIVTDRLPIRVHVILEAIMDWLALAVAAFIAWRHFYGLLDRFAYRETTQLLRLPLWWIYAAGMLGAAVFVIVALYCAIRSTAEAVSRHPRMPQSGFTE